MLVVLVLLVLNAWIGFAGDNCCTYTPPGQKTIDLSSLKGINFTSGIPDFPAHVVHATLCQVLPERRKCVNPSPLYLASGVAKDEVDDEHSCHYIGGDIDLCTFGKFDPETKSAVLMYPGPVIDSISRHLQITTVCSSSQREPKFGCSGLEIREIGTRVDIIYQCLLIAKQACPGFS